jgi:phosphatidylglycerol lysyltransferase
MTARIIEGREAKNLEFKVKWSLLSPYLKQYSTQAFSYATLQEGMEYFVLDNVGYVAFNTINHPAFARKPKRIVLGDPICSGRNIDCLTDAFLDFSDRKAVFTIISGDFADFIRKKSFKVNSLGYEPEMHIQTYNFKGNWKELDVIKRAKKEKEREGIEIKEQRVDEVDKKSLERVSRQWLSGKKLSAREIWIYARPPVFEEEADVRKFFAYDKDKNLEGFVFYDPIYRCGNVVGYSANISRCNEDRFQKLSVAVNCHAGEQFRQEGKEILNLCIAPFDKVDEGRFNDDFVLKIFVKTCRKYGHRVYNFRGLSFYKSKYRADEKQVYFASGSAMPLNDLYLSFLASRIASSYLGVIGNLCGGILETLFSKSKTNCKPHSEKGN